MCLRPIVSVLSSPSDRLLRSTCALASPRDKEHECNDGTERSAEGGERCADVGLWLCDGPSPRASCVLRGAICVAVCVAGPRCVGHGEGHDLREVYIVYATQERPAVGVCEHGRVLADGADEHSAERLHTLLYFADLCQSCGLVGDEEALYLRLRQRVACEQAPPAHVVWVLHCARCCATCGVGNSGHDASRSLQLPNALCK